MHHAAHRHTARREKDSERKRNKKRENTETEKKTGYVLDTVRVQSVPRLIFKFLAVRSEGDGIEKTRFQNRLIGKIKKLLI